MSPGVGCDSTAQGNTRYLLLGYCKIHRIWLAGVKFWGRCMMTLMSDLCVSQSSFSLQGDLN